MIETRKVNYVDVIITGVTPDGSLLTKKPRPYRANFDGWLWWLCDRNGHIITFAGSIEQLWQNAEICLQPVLSPFRNIE